MMQEMPSTLTGWLPEVVGCAGDGTGEPGPGAGCGAEGLQYGRPKMEDRRVGIEPEGVSFWGDRAHRDDARVK